MEDGSERSLMQERKGSCPERVRVGVFGGRRRGGGGIRVDDCFEFREWGEASLPNDTHAQ